jgi:hypothetical protein
MNRASNTTLQELRSFAVERLNDNNLGTVFRHELEVKLSSAPKPEPFCLDDKWKRIEEARTQKGVI